jgi:glycolate oxidase FAD binding subunit
MVDTLTPRDDKDVAAAITWALAQGKTLEIIGQGSKRAIGRAAQWDLTLDMSGLSGVSLYEPEELVLSARAGTPLIEIEALLAVRGQELAFEPMDYGPILGRAPGQGTLGGALAANLSGPRRIKAGAARDHFLGVGAVSGRGEIFKSGGRVVKNVTGYDLCKLLAGSWGTLAAMTEVTVKVLPRAETEATVLVGGLSDAAAVAAMAGAMKSSAEVSGAAHVPAGVLGTLAAAALGDGPFTAFRLEGVPPSVVHRKRTLEALLAPRGRVSALGELSSRTLWRAIRDVIGFAAQGSADVSPVWRVSTAPSNGPRIAAAVAAGCRQAQILYDWAGGLVWIKLPDLEDAGAGLVRGAVQAAGGSARLVRARTSLRTQVFAPQETALAALTERVKASFDPQRILGPGRMYAGV